ncbi:ubiA prenyltransferase family [Artemisia annua]|uniref:UbiA prenyltransferase family n=1 Tax=Artemisia annua TaxID=35608 RepID=A0A2U1ME01_ARTAN|nr:ubiA prenyltransferase family [Artemisia annua]
MTSLKPPSSSSSNSIKHRKPALVVNGASDTSHDAHDSRVVGREVNGKSLGATLYAIYKFARPFSLIGVVLSIVSLFLLAVEDLSDLTPSTTFRVLKATLGGCLVKLYVSGINQLSDIEIDKVNKPYLPLASGELSVKTGVLLTSFYAIMVLSIVSLFLLAVEDLSDLTPSTIFRVLKATLGGCLVKLYVSGINQLSDIEIDKVNKPYMPLASGELSVKTGILLTSFYAIMSVLLGWSIESLPLRLGLLLWFGYGTAYSVDVFWISIWLLEVAYGMAISIGLLSNTHFWIRSIMVIIHSVLGFIVWKYAKLVDIKSPRPLDHSTYLFER